MVSLSLPDRRQILAILPDQPGKFKGPREAPSKNLWLRNQPENPAEKKAVDPIGDRCLIACDEAKRGPGAMDRRPIRQIFAQIMSELFLWPTADRNHDMRWPAFLYQRKKMSIFDFQLVSGRDITIIDLDRKSFAAKTIEQFLPCALVW